MWSIGCIFGELMLRETLFQGQHNLKQLDKIIEVIGYPEDEEAELEFIKNDMTLNYIKKLPKSKGTLKINERIPNANPHALDLLLKMLRISPNKRITIEEAINHPYFSSFSHLGQPPVCDVKFDWNWDYFDLNKELL